MKHKHTGYEAAALGRIVMAQAADDQPPTDTAPLDEATGIDAPWTAYRTRRQPPAHRAFRREWNRYLAHAASAHGGWGNLTRD